MKSLYEQKRDAMYLLESLYTERQVCERMLRKSLIMVEVDAAERRRAELESLTPAIGYAERNLAALLSAEYIPCVTGT